MKKKLYKKTNITSVTFIISIILILLLSIGYSSFNTKLSISSIISEVQPITSISITDFTVESTSSLDNYSNYESFTNNSITSNIHLNDDTGWIKYKVTIINLGNEIMGIANYLEDTLPNSLTYDIENYILKDPLCDDNNINNCTLNATKNLYITIKYKNGEINSNAMDYVVKLSFDYQKFYNVTYSSRICENCPDKAIGNSSLEVTLSNYYNIEINMGEALLKIGNDYTFNSDGLLIINNVRGDILILNDPYTEIDFIETTNSTDGQYINTLYIPNNKTTIIYDGMVVDGDTALFGVRNGMNGNQRFTIQFISTYNYRLSYKDEDIKINSSYQENERYLFKVNGNYLYINNFSVNEIPSNLKPDFQALDNLYLFAVNTNGVAGNFGTVRLYSLKIYEDNYMVKHFVPVLDYNNIPCLYEKVEGTLYYNQGNGNFNYNELTNYAINNNIENVTFSNEQSHIRSGTHYSTNLILQNNRNFPESLTINSDSLTLIDGVDYEYNKTNGYLEVYDVRNNLSISESISRELPFIISSEGQYIDTEYIPNENTKIVFTHTPLFASATKWIALFGCKNGTTNTSAFYVSMGTTNNFSKISAYFGGIQYNNSNIDFTHNVGVPQVIILSATEFKILSNGIEVINYTNSNPLNIGNTVNSIYIFGRNIDNSSNNYPSNIKFVSMQIYENDVLIKDFVPYTTYDGKIGVYDKVNEIFYDNKSSVPFLIS